MSTEREELLKRFQNMFGTFVRSVEQKVVTDEERCASLDGKKYALWSEEKHCYYGISRFDKTDSNEIKEAKYLFGDEGFVTETNTISVLMAIAIDVTSKLLGSYAVIPISDEKFQEFLKAFEDKDIETIKKIKV